MPAIAPPAPPATPAAPVPHPQLLDALAAEDALRDLAARLALAASRVHPAPAALDALTRLAPDDAVRWLLACGRSLRNVLPADARARALATLAAEARNGGDPALAHGVRALAIAHPDAVMPDTLVALAECFPPERVPELLGSLVDRALGRHPEHAGLLSVAADVAIRHGDAPRAHSLLDRAGLADPSPASVQRVRARRAGLPDPPGVRARVALMGSFTLDPLVPFLDLECRAAGMVPSFHLAPFGAWEREARDPASATAEFAPDAVFLAAALDDLVPDLAGSPSPGALHGAGEEAVGRVVSAAQAFRASSSAALVVFGFHTAFADPLGPAGSGAGSRAAWVADLNARLAESLAEVADTWMLDVGDVLARRGGGAADDPRLRHMARMRIPPAALGALARACAGYVAPLRGLTRKCIAVDLDNTLWGGLAGEDGVAGIRLGDTAPGSEHVELQRWLKSMADRGFLLAAVSKNNEADALEVIRGHDAMVLREGDFAARRINWLPKHENIAAIAEELGIGLDSVVFVDDSREERDLVRRMLPQVLTPELPADAARFRAALETLPQLQQLRVTDADRARGGQYRVRVEREQAKAASGGSLGDFLHSLELVVQVAPAAPATLSRVHQLFQRTNQFNLTTRRHDLAHLAAAANDHSRRLFALRAHDRLSDHGLVGAALVEMDGSRWRVESLVLSCRVIGYGVETAFVAALASAAREAGASTLEGEMVPTEKNHPARDCWARHGFAHRETADGVETWERALDDGGPAAPEWVRLEVADAS
jgi:FkbH-like protein